MQVASTKPEPRRPTPALSRALKRPAFVGAVGLASLTAALSITTTPAIGASPGDAPAPRVANADVQINRSLDALAKLTARAISEDVSLRRQIRSGAAKRFDGDTDVLYTKLSETSGIRRSLAAAYSRGSRASQDEALTAVDRLAGAVPRFHVSVPVNFDSWDAATYSPLVAYMPAGVEDTTLKTVTAYDSAGNAHQLDAQVEPDQPVIVLGINERTDDSGKLLRPKNSGPSAASASAPSARAAALGAKYEVRMVQVSLFDDKEPWPQGDAEISMKAKSYARSATCGVDFLEPNWALLNNSGDAWGPPTPRGLGSTCADVGFAWWEDDGDAKHYALTIGDFSLGVQMDNDDDMLGKQRVGHGTFSGASMENVRWAAISQWTD